MPQTPGRRACKRVTSAPFAGRSQSLHRLPNAVRTGVEHGERASVHRVDTLARKRRHHRFVPQHRVHVARRIPAHPSNKSINAPPLCGNQEPGPHCCTPSIFTNEWASSLAACAGGTCACCSLHSHVACATHRSKFAFSLSRLPHSFSGSSTESFLLLSTCCALPLPRQLSLQRKCSGQYAPTGFTKATSTLTGSTSLNSNSRTQRGLYDTVRARVTMAGRTCSSKRVSITSLKSAKCRCHG
jgi:hypothetical protein